MASEKTETGDTPSNPQDGDSGGTVLAPSATQRYVVSHRLAPYADDKARRQAKARFSDRFVKALGASVDLLADQNADREDGRRVLIVAADRAELLAKSKELSPDTLIEPELLREPAVLRLAPPRSGIAQTDAVTAQDAAAAAPAFVLQILCAGAPLPHAQVTLSLAALTGAAAASTVTAITDARGVAALAYDAAIWYPTMAQIAPQGRSWSAVVVRPLSGSVVNLDRLPKSGPLSWWHQLAGISTPDPRAGEGIRIGVVDTGLGPHPYLSHITPAGAFTDGSFEAGAVASQDVEWHGTHVSGIIGARPTEGSGEFIGLAPAATIFTARVFKKDAGANQGDIANAIDAMVITHEVDLINLSLGGAPSAIEFDAVLSAYNRGTLCICAAGNENGQPVTAPACYPIAVAVTALGYPGTAPANNLAMLTIPQQADRFAANGLFLASYSNFGPQVAVTAAGSAIISTIPADEADQAPYADMSGTSMASPLTTGALAILLSRDPIYRTLQRAPVRAQYARARLLSQAFNLGLAPIYQGAGLSRAV